MTRSFPATPTLSSGAIMFETKASPGGGVTPCSPLTPATPAVTNPPPLGEPVEVPPRGCEGDRTGSEEAVTVRRIPRRHVAERQRDDLVPEEGDDPLYGAGETDLEAGPPHRLLEGGRRNPD